MDRLPRVLQNEIWEYVHGDRPFFKQQFKRTMTEFLLYVRAYFRNFPTGTTFMALVKMPLEKKHRLIVVNQVLQIGSQEAVVNAWNERQCEIVHSIEEKREWFGFDHFGHAHEHVLRLIRHYYPE
jgi:hypothetical protein